MWGAFGGFVAVAVELTRVVRACGQLPWRDEANPVAGSAYLIALFARIVIGCGLAWALVGVLTDPWQALSVGFAAPVVIEKLADVVVTMVGGKQS